MQLNFPLIKIKKPAISISSHLSANHIKKKIFNTAFLEIIDYAISLLKEDDLDLKIKILVSVIEKNKNVDQLIEEFGKSTNLLKSIYELVSLGLIIERRFWASAPNVYQNHEYNFDVDRFIFRIRKNLVEKRQILTQEKKLFENEILFTCNNCQTTYEYGDAINGDFYCCGNRIQAMMKTDAINEIDEKLEIINKKLNLLNKL